MSTSPSASWPFLVYSTTMSYLPAREVLLCRRLNQSFKRNGEYYELWEYLVERDYPQFHLDKVTQNTSDVDSLERMTNLFFDCVVGAEVEQQRQQNKEGHSVQNNQSIGGKLGDDNVVSSYDPLVAQQHPIFFCRGRLLYCFAGLSLRFPFILQEVLRRSIFRKEPELFSTFFQASNDNNNNTNIINPILEQHKTQSIEEREVEYESLFTKYRNQMVPATLDYPKWPRVPFSMLSDGVFDLEPESVVELRNALQLLSRWRMEISQNKKNASNPKNKCNNKETTVPDVATFSQDCEDLKEGSTAAFRHLFGNKYLRFFGDLRDVDDNSEEINNNNNDDGRKYSNKKKELRTRRGALPALSTWYTARDIKKNPRIVHDNNDDEDAEGKHQKKSYERYETEQLHFLTVFDAIFVVYAYHLPRWTYCEKCVGLSELLNSGLWSMFNSNNTSSTPARPVPSSSVINNYDNNNSDKNNQTLKFRLSQVQHFFSLLHASFLGRGQLSAVILLLHAFPSFNPMTLMSAFSSSSTAAETTATNPMSSYFSGLLFPRLENRSTYWPLLFLCPSAIIAIQFFILSFNKHFKLLFPIRASQIFLINLAPLITAGAVFSQVLAGLLAKIWEFLYLVASELQSDNNNVEENKNSIQNDDTYNNVALKVLPFSIALVYLVTACISSIPGVYKAVVVGNLKEYETNVNKDDEENKNNSNIYDMQCDSLFLKSRYFVEDKLSSILKSARITSLMKRKRNEKDQATNNNKVVVDLVDIEKRSVSDASWLFFAQYVFLVIGLLELMIRGASVIEMILWSVLMEVLCRGVSRFIR